MRPENELSVTFDSTCSADSDGTIVSRTWIFGDATSADGVKATHQYSEAGTYTATLLVTDNEGRTSDTSITMSFRFASTSVTNVSRNPLNPTVTSARHCMTSGVSSSLISFSAWIQPMNSG